MLTGKHLLDLMAEEPWTYVQASKLKVHGIAPARFTNSPVAKIKGP